MSGQDERARSALEEKERKEREAKKAAHNKALKKSLDTFVDNHMTVYLKANATQREELHRALAKRLWDHEGEKPLYGEAE